MQRQAKTALMAIFKWLRDLWKAKVSITLVFPPAEGVVSTTIPQVKKQETAAVIKHNKSNTRFVAYTVEPINGAARTYYYTETYVNKSWTQVDNTWFADKDEAMAAHLKFLKGASLAKEIKTTEVLWEGLDLEETKSWIELNKSTAPDERVASGVCQV